MEIHYFTCTNTNTVYDRYIIKQAQARLKAFKNNFVDFNSMSIFIY